MSDAQQPDPHDDHASLIRTPKQLIVVVVASFVLPVIIIILLVNFVAFGGKKGAGSDGMSEEAVARRLQPVGTVELRDVSTPAAARTGEQVYQAQCAACHATGAANAPKLGDAAAWAPRVATGFEALLASVLNGKGAMPKQSGGDTTDHELARAVVYVANQGGAKFAEPAAPAAAASAAASAPK
ncbi:MAG: cytochrome c5 family protein [Betaproteobacteria bacterium]|nr:cytochrome c5 family protein [Betaproteobacteria bacterium]